MRRCSATTAAGEPCRAWAMRGSDRCAAHLALGGRKTQLTDGLQDQLITMLRAGNYIEVACRAVNLPRRTFSYWMARGRSDDARDARYREFVEQVEQARALAEVRNVAVVTRAAADTWQAAAWLLERQHSERWARISQREKPDEPERAAQPADPFEEVDELAERRTGRTT